MFEITILGSSNHVDNSISTSALQLPDIVLNALPSSSSSSSSSPSPSSPSANHRYSHHHTIEWIKIGPLLKDQIIPLTKIFPVELIVFLVRIN
ncbi:GTP-binding protein SAR1a, variant 2 [Dermatophagoides farinae]|uniref:GTP-binding protein SAR1a, variant 2 n=1 Tax=Dermatophagoides farinae TaxID=6954 RepID=A0A922HZ69_DERFA|nr:GTP-binding protein SAR1a, variant 2 [Dermatophagoides farinae]